jgi:phage terminase large subunit
MGRKPTEISQREFENLCAMQCTMLEVCEFFNVTDKTLQGWCVRTYKKKFSEVFKEKSARGKISLRRSQLRLAETNATMAIFLGKQYLGQRDERTEGLQPTERYSGLPARILGDAYLGIYRDITARKHRFYDFKGGRGSLKSSFCAEALIDDLELNPEHCAIAIRQVKDTLKDSVYAQIVWAIDELGLTGEYKCTVSPLEIRKKTTGQRIYFRGADDPLKIKSIKPPRGMYIGIMWIEEADQLHGQEALRSILQSVMRGGDDAVVLRSYNTPISKQHYINKEALEDKPNRVIHHSSYLEAPPEWLGKPFFEEAEYLKLTNEKAYRHEYLGEAVGTGGSVFENVNAREITKEEVEVFDRLYYGVDWGYYPDPFAWVKMYFNSAQRKLYIFDEYVAKKQSNKDTADYLMEQKGVTGGDMIIADSAEPKSIADYRDYGLYCVPVKKGPDSVKYSMKWLQGLTEIVIDPVRCPVTAEEFLSYEYEKTKDDEIISGYPDKNNHCIDAARYGMWPMWRIGGE